jgi:hypothetical protein
VGEEREEGGKRPKGEEGKRREIKGRIWKREREKRENRRREREETEETEERKREREREKYFKKK